MARVKVYMNATTDFMKWKPNDVMVHVYTMDVDRLTEALILDAVFNMLNVGHPTDYKHRSLSCGDVLMIFNQDKSWSAHAVEFIGWTTIMRGREVNGDAQSSVL